MAICGGLQRWLSKLAYHAMLAQRSSGGGEKKMSCAVAWISCPRWTKMLLDSKERGSNQHQIDISSCKSHRQQSSHDRSQTPESQTSEKFGLSLRSISVVVYVSLILD